MRRTKNREKKVVEMIEEDLEDTYVDLLAETEKNDIYEKVLANLSQSKPKEKVANSKTML